jgi:hypothetical protein
VCLELSLILHCWHDMGAFIGTCCGAPLSKAESALSSAVRKLEQHLVSDWGFVENSFMNFIDPERRLWKSPPPVSEKISKPVGNTVLNPDNAKYVGFRMFRQSEVHDSCYKIKCCFQSMSPPHLTMPFCSYLPYIEDSMKICAR